MLFERSWGGYPSSRRSTWSWSISGPFCRWRGSKARPSSFSRGVWDGRGSSITSSFEEPMLISVLKSKLHQARVTDKNTLYMGSITIDRELMDFAGLRPYERVEVYD